MPVTTPDVLNAILAVSLVDQTPPPGYPTIAIDAPGHKLPLPDIESGKANTVATTVL
jgi:hypothetical protein